MKRLPLSPRPRIAACILVLPLLFLFFRPARPLRPSFDPYAEELEDGYRIHLSPQYEDGWRAKVPSLGLTGLGLGSGKEAILITGGAGQLGASSLDCS